MFTVVVVVVGDRRFNERTPTRPIVSRIARVYLEQPDSGGSVTIESGSYVVGVSVGPIFE